MTSYLTTDEAAVVLRSNRKTVDDAVLLRWREAAAFCGAILLARGGE